MKRLIKMFTRGSVILRNAEHVGSYTCYVTVKDNKPSTVEVKLPIFRNSLTGYIIPHYHMPDLTARLLSSLDNIASTIDIDARQARLVDTVMGAFSNGMNLTSLFGILPQMMSGGAAIAIQMDGDAQTAQLDDIPDAVLSEVTQAVESLTKGTISLVTAELISNPRIISVVTQLIEGEVPDPLDSQKSDDQSGNFEPIFPVLR